MLRNKLLQQTIIACVTVLLISVFIYHVIVSAKTLHASPQPLVLSILKDLGSLKEAATDFWLRHLSRAVLCVIFFFCAWWLGNLSLKLLKLKDLSVEKSVLLSTGLGLGILGYLVFFFGILRLLNPKFLIVVFIVIAVASVLHTVFFMGNISKPAGLSANIYLWLAVPFLMLAFFATTFPEIFYDSLTYHLAIPQIYLQEGRLVNIPTNIYSTITHLTSLIYAWGLALDGVYLVKLMNFAFGVLLVCTIYTIGSELAVIFFVSIPVFALNHWCAGSDMSMTFFLLLGLSTFYDWVSDNEPQEYQLYLSGLLLGLAMSSKYNAGFGIPFLIGTLIFCYSKNIKKVNIKTIIIFLVFILLPVLPWWIKNYIYTGSNPFLPFLTNIFGTGTWAPESVASLRSDLQHGYGGLKTVMGGFLQIFKVIVTGAREGRAGFIGPVFLVLLPLVLLNFRNKKVRWAFYYLLSVTVFWLFSTHMVRHLVPHLTVVFIAVSLTMKKNRVTKTICIILACTNLFWLISIFQMKYHGLKVLTGQQTSSEYLKSEHPGIYSHPSYGAYEFIKDKIQDRNKRILILGEARQFYCPNPAISNTVHDIPIFFDTIYRSIDTVELRKWLNSEDINYILVNWGEIKRLIPKKYLNKKSLAITQNFFKQYTTAVYSDKWVTLYRRDNRLIG